LLHEAEKVAKEEKSWPRPADFSEAEWLLQCLIFDLCEKKCRFQQAFFSHK
jgi:hypothetical protein